MFRSVLLSIAVTFVLLAFTLYVNVLDNEWSTIIALYYDCIGILIRFILCVMVMVRIVTGVTRYAQH